MSFKSCFWRIEQATASESREPYLFSPRFQILRRPQNPVDVSMGYRRQGNRQPNGPRVRIGGKGREEESACKNGNKRRQQRWCYKIWTDLLAISLNDHRARTAASWKVYLGAAMAALMAWPLAKSALKGASQWRRVALALHVELDTLAGPHVVSGRSLALLLQI